MNCFNWMGLALIASATLLCAGAASADCNMVETAEFHVDPKAPVPIVDGEINGQPVKILLDTGSTTSIVLTSEAKRLKLVMSAPHIGERMYDVGGSTAVYDANIKELKIGAFKATNLDLLVAGDPDAHSDVTLILGDDFFSRTDVEFDLRDGAVRLFEPKGCTPPQLIYWGHAYSQATILPSERDEPKTQTTAVINGKTILAQFDSGSPGTSIDQAAAEAVGVAPPDGQPDKTTHGLGPRPAPVWTGHFDSLALGDEKLSNIRLEVVSFARDMAQSWTGSLIPYRLDSTAYLSIGADFLHAHRVFIDNKDHLILFSYEGGPVFQAPASAASAAGH